MNWPDDEFEAFLRQFRPRPPKALPTYRWRIVALATAAIITAAIVVPMRYGLKDVTTSDSTQAPASTLPAIPASKGGAKESGPLEAQPAPVLDRLPTGAKSAGAASASPTLAPGRGVNRLDSPPKRATGATGPENQRLQVGGAVLPPTKIFDVKPVYPEDAQAAGIEGVVILGAVIGQDGSVIETWILRSIPELDQAAIDAVSQWQFEPVLLNGEPVEVQMTATINFTLQ